MTAVAQPTTPPWEDAAGEVVGTALPLVVVVAAEDGDAGREDVAAPEHLGGAGGGGEDAFGLGIADDGAELGHALGKKATAHLSQLTISALPPPRPAIQESQSVKEAPASAARSRRSGERVWSKVGRSRRRRRWRHVIAQALAFGAQSGQAQANMDQTLAGAG